MSRDQYPSDGAIITARIGERSGNHDALIERYPDQVFTAIDAARRLDREPTLCEQSERDPVDYCGGCKVPLD